MRKTFFVSMLIFVMLAASVSAIFAQDDADTRTDETEVKTWLGVSVVETDDQVIVRRVKSGSPADTADLQVGDVIVSYNGTALTTANELSDLVEAAAPGDTATLEILRNEETLQVEITLGSTPVREGRGSRTYDLPEDALSAIETLLYVDLQEAEDGFQVVNVFAGRNPLDLEEGDILTTLNGQAVTDLDVAALAQALTDDNGLTLTLIVVRDGEELTLEDDLSSGRGGRGGRPGGHGDDHRGGPDDSDLNGNPDEETDSTEEVPAENEGSTSTFAPSGQL